MARKSKKSIHPLQMAEALEAMNEAAGIFAMKVSTYAKFLDTYAADPAKVKAMAADMEEDVEVFRAVMWPQEES